MSRIRPQRFVHVVYRTRRFADMIDWYRTVFDARIQFRNDILAFLTYDEEHHRFALVNFSALDPRGSEVDRSGQIGVDHVAYTYASLRALLENWEQLKALGVEPYWAVHHGVTISLYYRDPDGNRMEFQADSYPTPEEANAFMAGPGYAENPIGVEFVPADWLAQLRAGVPESHFLVRTQHQPIPDVNAL
jgi:catechol 2,3-dioxygenase-like lactoylglutathione lyase family enzyme